jgi:hypothetical protein
LSDNYRNRRFDTYLRRRGTALWSILSELAGFDEPTLRGVLRPHDEGGLSYQRDGDIMELRARLDIALDALTLLEIGYETGVVDPKEQEVPALGSLSTLFQSESLLQYANAYLYFGVRFLCYRDFPPIWVTVLPLQNKT